MVSYITGDWGIVYKAVENRVSFSHLLISFANQTSFQALVFDPFGNSSSFPNMKRDKSESERQLKVKKTKKSKIEEEESEEEVAGPSGLGSHPPRSKPKKVKKAKKTKKSKRAEEEREEDVAGPSGLGSHPPKSKLKKAKKTKQSKKEEEKSMSWELGQCFVSTSSESEEMDDSENIRSHFAKHMYYGSDEDDDSDNGAGDGGAGSADNDNSGDSENGTGAGDDGDSVDGADSNNSAGDGGDSDGSGEGSADDGAKSDDDSDNGGSENGAGDDGESGDGDDSDNGSDRDNSAGDGGGEGDGASNIDNGAGDDSDNDSAFGFGRDDGAGDDVSDDADDGNGANGRADGNRRPRKQNRKRRPVQPAADANPGGPSNSSAVTTGWTRHLKRVKTHRYRPDNTPGPNFNRLPRAVDYFFKFFPLMLFTFIRNMTNIKLRKVHKTETTTEEIRAWFGIRMVMALCILRDMDDYWSDHPGFRNELISKTMTKNRFQDISGSLACSHPDRDPIDMPSSTTREKQNKYNFIHAHPKFHFQKIWDTVLECCRSQYTCLRNLSIDEAMIPYRGFKAWCQKFFMPGKPVRAGFKVYAMAEAASGYMCNFKIHVPSQTPTKYSDVAFNVAMTHLDKFHHIFMDRLYTNLELAKDLYSRNTYLTGAVRTNSRGLPDDMSFLPARNRHNLKAIAELKKTPRGTFYARQQGPYTYVLWNDSSILSLLSSAHSAYRAADQFVTRRFVLDGEGNLQRRPHPIPAPPAVINYCESMGGVDRADQLRAYHSIARKAQSWWKQVLYFLVDIARVNAWICYKSHHAEGQGTPLTHSKFVMAVATQLIDGYQHGAQDRRQTRAEPVPLANFNGLHTSTHMDSTCKCCKLCAATKKKTPGGWPVKSYYGCPTCGVHLCPGFCFAR